MKSTQFHRRGTSQICSIEKQEVRIARFITFRHLDTGSNTCLREPFEDPIGR
jgi:hypothetical protein